MHSSPIRQCIVIFCLVTLALVFCFGGECIADDENPTSGNIGLTASGLTFMEEDTILAVAFTDPEGFGVPHPSNDVGVFVALSGSNQNPGTMEAPKRTIQAGVNLAETQDKVVFVGRGIYVEAVETSVSLYGGYVPQTWQRNMVRNPTAIDSLARSAVTIYPAADNEPVQLDGFAVYGGKLNN